MKHSHDKGDRRAVTLSVLIYQRLLASYPPKYRREYGPAMTQLFRDQCRDAWRGGRAWGLAGLWLRVVPDLVKTSVLEHILTLNGRKTMMERINAVLVRQAAPRRLFLAAFAAVFLLVAGTSTVITFLLPESYSSTARVKVEQDANAANGYDPYFIMSQIEFIQSDMLLANVVEKLKLDQLWGKKYGGGKPLKPAETVSLLKARIDLRPVRNTMLIAVGVFSDEPSEAARLANAIARAYQEHNAAKNRPEIVDSAVPGLRPVRPNKPLNITVGILTGALLASVAGAVLAGIAWWLRRRSG